MTQREALIATGVILLFVLVAVVILVAAGVL